MGRTVVMLKYVLICFKIGLVLTKTIKLTNTIKKTRKFSDKKLSLMDDI